MGRRDAYRNAWKPPGLCTDLVAVSAATEGGVRTSGEGVHGGQEAFKECGHGTCQYRIYPAVQRRRTEARPRGLRS